MNRQYNTSGMNIVKRYLWFSQASLIICLVICYLMLPSVMDNNGGASNFGDGFPTVIPYTLGFALSALLLWAAASKLSEMEQKLRKTPALVATIGVLDLLVLLTTFDRKVNHLYYLVHDYLGVTLFAYEFALSVWIVYRTKSFATALFLLVGSIGSLIGLLSLVGPLRLLFAGQMIGGIGFGLVLTVGFPSAIAALS